MEQAAIPVAEDPLRLSSQHVILPALPRSSGEHVEHDLQPCHGNESKSSPLLSSPTSLAP